MGNLCPAKKVDKVREVPPYNCAKVHPPRVTFGNLFRTFKKSAASIEAPLRRVNSQNQPIIILLYSGLQRSRDTNSSTPSHLKHVATLPCEVWMSENWWQSEKCIAINDKWQASTELLHYKNLSLNLLVKTFFKSVNIWRSYKQNGWLCHTFVLKDAQLAW